MSYIALVTSQYDEVTDFYGEQLGFPVVDQWDRANGRGRRFDTGGMRLEIIDNEREQHQRSLGETADKVHIVVEVDTIDEAKNNIKLDAPSIQDTSWGSRLFRVRDPDGISVTFLQWVKNDGGSS